MARRKPCVFWSYGTDDPKEQDLREHIRELCARSNIKFQVILPTVLESTVSAFDDSQLVTIDAESPDIYVSVGKELNNAIRHVGIAATEYDGNIMEQIIDGTALATTEGTGP